MLYMMHANIIAQYFDGKILSNLACLGKKKDMVKLKEDLRRNWL